MLDNQITEKYSKALFELAVEKEKVDEIKEELAEVLETINGHKDLNEVMYHPQISQTDKNALLEKVFDAEISKVLLNFLKLLVDKRREKFLEPILDRYIEMANEKKDILEVKVKSAIELSATNKTRLKNKLEQLTEKQVTLIDEVDADLIGGLVLEVGDKVIDGSLNKHLQVIKDDLSKIEVSKLGVN